mmetsp:Transcript_54479/g.129860  ORF Transcript_54479/g.129860 Transcript_54479/m.129860 type:complete len:230 (+) Transcript_54479:824-1513(+)
MIEARLRISPVGSDLCALVPPVYCVLRESNAQMIILVSLASWVQTIIRHLVPPAWHSIAWIIQYTLLASHCNMIKSSSLYPFKLDTIRAHCQCYLCRYSLVESTFALEEPLLLPVVHQEVGAIVSSASHKTTCDVLAWNDRVRIDNRSCQKATHPSRALNQVIIHKQLLAMQNSQVARWWHPLLSACTKRAMMLSELISRQLVLWHSEVQRVLQPYQGIDLLPSLRSVV